MFVRIVISMVANVSEYIPALRKSNCTIHIDLTAWDMHGC